MREFAEVSLPSFLAPGNLPYLAEHADLEVVILTTIASVEAFEAEPGFQRLCSLCTVRFLHIDDLVTSANYGVTLTLAYARGVIDAGEEQTQTWFVFMNSDFVLADGGMRTLVRCFEEGRRCILSASLRARAEEALPVLREAATAGDGVLAIQPRDAVDLALAYPHATVIAKTVTQNAVTCLTHNQLYWVADSTTLLARNHLIFMLAIRPERPMRQVNSYCDYGFVPEMCPSGQHYVIGDSDDFFMLELQPATQERDFLRGGKARVRDMAKHLSQWTTREHRAFARHDVVFHSGDLPESLPRYRKAATAFVDALQAQMGPPVDHVDHFYWSLGVQAWKLHRAQMLGLPSIPEALIPVELSVETRPATDFISLVNRMRRALGRMPDVALWHHRWPDSMLLKDWRAGVGAIADRSCAIIAWPDKSIVARVLAAQTGVRLVTVEKQDRLPASFTSGAQTFQKVLLYAPRMHVRSAGDIISAIDPVLEVGGRISVFVDHTDAELDASDFTTELAQYTDQILHSFWMRYEIDILSVGGRFRRRLRLLERRIVRRLVPSGLMSAPLFAIAVVAWPLVAAATAVVNLASRRSSRASEPYATSAMLELRKVQSAGPRRFRPATAPSVDTDASA